MSDDTSTATGAPGASQPNEHMSELDFFLGTWDAPGVFHETPFGPRKPIQMRIEWPCAAVEVLAPNSTRSDDS